MLLWKMLIFIILLYEVNGFILFNYDVFLYLDVVGIVLFYFILYFISLHIP